MEPYIALLIIVGVPIVIWVFKLRHNQKANERLRFLAIASAVSEVQAQLDKVSSLKGMTERLSRCKDALNKLEEVRQIEGYEEIVKNYDDVHARLESMIKVIPVIDHIDRACQHRSRGKDNPELNALTDALSEIQTGQVSNEDFVKAELFPESAEGEIIHIEGIQGRLKELGWDGPGEGDEEGVGAGGTVPVDRGHSPS